ncbi:hypothetical protein BC833DRAFT_576461 [Globomyces pollinis-pini]|nr:hypothetical protein BC833DRAFT_576461 [Globomyces pollinis-pini]
MTDYKNQIVTDYPCKKYACAIQACLIRNNYADSNCTKELAEFENCCKLLDPNTPLAKTACLKVWKKLKIQH